MKPSCLVSCIIPLYNKAPYICRAIDSILRQTIQDFEIIVVNGESTDGSEKEIEKYHDSRIKIINQKNQGVSVARNTGFLNAKAELIAFLDADDAWCPNYLETILLLREKWPNAGLYATAAQQIDEYGKITYRIYEGQSIQSLIENYFQLKNKLGFEIIFPSWMVIPKKILNQIGGFPSTYICCEDVYVRAKIALSYPFAYSSTIGAIYYRNDNTYIERTKKSIEVIFNNPKYWDENEVYKHKYSQDIIEFVDREKLFIGTYALLYSKDRTNLRNDLKKIYSARFSNRKRIYILLSYFPGTMLQYGRKCLMCLSNPIFIRLVHILHL